VPTVDRRRGHGDHQHTEEPLTVAVGQAIHNV